jgi:hypothetical protein
MNIKNAVDKEWEEKPLSEIVDAPIAALQGVGEAQAMKLQSEFGVKTIRELSEFLDKVENLASKKYVKWARAITLLGEKEH